MAKCGPTSWWASSTLAESSVQKPGSIPISFQSKVLIPVLIFLFLVPVVTLTVMQRHVTGQFERDAERKLKTAERLFQSYLQKRSGFLHARYRNLVQEPRFRAIAKLVAETQNFDDVKPTLDDFLKRTFSEFEDEEAQVMLFTSVDDTFLPIMRDPDLRGEDFHFAARSLIRSTLEEGATNQVVVVKRHLYNAVSVPVTMNDDPVGVLTVFVPITEAAAREFASQTGTDFALFVGRSLAATTLPIQSGSSEIQLLFDRPNSVQKTFVIHNHFFAYAGSIPAIP